MASDYKIVAYSEDALPDAISPEGAEVANTYLVQACSLHQTAKYLNMETYQVSAILDQPLVKNYVNRVLKEHSLQHMVKISAKLDEVIDRKWIELEEAEMGSNKDIAELLSLAFQMQEKMAKLLQAEDKKEKPLTQNNTQINNYGEGNYGRLMQKIIEG